MKEAAVGFESSRPALTSRQLHTVVIVRPFSSLTTTAYESAFSG